MRLPFSLSLDVDFPDPFSQGPGKLPFRQQAVTPPSPPLVGGHSGDHEAAAGIRSERNVEADPDVGAGVAVRRADCRVCVQPLPALLVGMARFCLSIVVKRPTGQSTHPCLEVGVLLVVISVHVPRVRV